MKLLRHEEMDSGCAAQCNGDFESPWSKTMVAYGDENSYFCFELNYNYEVEGYQYGNDFSSVTIRSREAVTNAYRLLDPKSIESYNDDKKSIIIRSPDGHKFILINDDVKPGNDPVQRLSLNVSNLNKSIDYYTRLLKMKIVEQKTNNHVILCYGLQSPTDIICSKVKTKSGFIIDDQCQLELIATNNNQPIERGTGYGRKAFSCPIEDIETIQKIIENENFTIVIPEIKLGDDMLDSNKVTVVILGDPDGHEICFVGEENYANGCKTDDDAEKKICERFRK